MQPVLSLKQQQDNNVYELLKIIRMWKDAYRPCFIDAATRDRCIDLFSIIGHKNIDQCLKRFYCGKHKFSELIMLHESDIIDAFYTVLENSCPSKQAPRHNKIATPPEVQFVNTLKSGHLGNAIDLLYKYTQYASHYVLDLKKSAEANKTILKLIESLAGINAHVSEEELKSLTLNQKQQLIQSLMQLLLLAPTVEKMTPKMWTTVQNLLALLNGPDELGPVTEKLELDTKEEATAIQATKDLWLSLAQRIKLPPAVAQKYIPFNEMHPNELILLGFYCKCKYAQDAATNPAKFKQKYLEACQKKKDTAENAPGDIEFKEIMTQLMGAKSDTLLWASSKEEELLNTFVLNQLHRDSFAMKDRNKWIQDILPFQQTIPIEFVREFRETYQVQLAKYKQAYPRIQQAKTLKINDTIAAWANKAK